MFFFFLFDVGAKEFIERGRRKRRRAQGMTLTKMYKNAIGSIQPKQNKNIQNLTHELSLIKKRSAFAQGTKD